MLKRTICWVLVFVGLFFITACSGKQNIQNETTFDFSFTDEIGNSKENVFNNLNISKEQVKLSKLQGRYDLVTPITYYGTDFTKYFLFYKNNGNEKLYGGGYECRTANNEKLKALVKDIVGELTDKYGEPATYPELDNKISNNNDFSANINGTLAEIWNVDENNLITLRLDFMQDNVLVNVECKQNTTR